MAGARHRGRVVLQACTAAGKDGPVWETDEGPELRAGVGCLLDCDWSDWLASSVVWVGWLGGAWSWTKSWHCMGATGCPCADGADELPPSAPGNTCACLQGVKAAEAEGHAAAQAIADKLPGCKCRWRESDVRTKLRQRFNYLKDPVGAASLYTRLGSSTAAVPARVLAACARHIQCVARARKPLHHQIMCVRFWLAAAMCFWLAAAMCSWLVTESCFWLAAAKSNCSGAEAPGEKAGGLAVSQQGGGHVHGRHHRQHAHRCMDQSNMLCRPLNTLGHGYTQPPARLSINLDTSGWCPQRMMSIAAAALSYHHLQSGR